MMWVIYNNMPKLIVLVAIIGLVALGSIVAIASPREKVSLSIEVIQGKILSQTSDTLVLLAPDKYKIVRAAYGDDCFYNLAGKSTYGSGEDVISVNGSSEYTYKISCQTIIGRGEITSKTKTVIVLEPAEIRAPEVVLSSQ